MLHFFTAVVIPRRVRFGVFISVRVGVHVCVRASALHMHIYKHARITVSPRGLLSGRRRCLVLAQPRRNSPILYHGI